jgi:c-di-GMP-binding flagellar brake protein YcgR
MPQAGAIVGKAMAAIIADAVARNLSVDFIRLLPTGHDACRSRFIEVPGMALAVEVPSRMGHPVPVRPGENVEIRFRLRDQPYYFRSTVARRTQVALTERLNMAILALLSPKTLHPLQRRQFVRVPVDAREQLVAHLWPGDDQGRIDDVEPPAAEILDLSGGGLRVVVEGALRGRFKEGRAVLVHIDLADGRPPLVLRAHVERVDRSVAHQARLGIHFEDLDESPQGRAARDRLTRYVARRQSAELQRMKR